VAEGEEEAVYKMHQSVSTGLDTDAGVARGARPAAVQAAVVSFKTTRAEIAAQVTRR